MLCSTADTTLSVLTLTCTNHGIQPICRISRPLGVTEPLQCLKVLPLLAIVKLIMLVVE